MIQRNSWEASITKSRQKPDHNIVTLANRIEDKLKLSVSRTKIHSTRIVNKNLEIQQRQTSEL